MSDQRSPTDWICYDQWPGPTFLSGFWDDIKAATESYQQKLIVSARAFGKLAALSAHVSGTAVDINADGLDDAREKLMHFFTVYEEPPVPSKPAILERKKFKGKPTHVGPRGSRQFDHRGRRRF